MPWPVEIVVSLTIHQLISDDFYSNLPDNCCPVSIHYSDTQPWSHFTKKYSNLNTMNCIFKRESRWLMRSCHMQFVQMWWKLKQSNTCVNFFWFFVCVFLLAWCNVVFNLSHSDAMRSTEITTAQLPFIPWQGAAPKYYLKLTQFL